MGLVGDGGGRVRVALRITFGNKGAVIYVRQFQFIFGGHRILSILDSTPEA